VGEAGAAEGEESRGLHGRRVCGGAPLVRRRRAPAGRGRARLQGVLQLRSRRGERAESRVRGERVAEGQDGRRHQRHRVRQPLPVLRGLHRARALGAPVREQRRGGDGRKPRVRAVRGEAVRVDGRHELHGGGRARADALRAGVAAAAAAPPLARVRAPVPFARARPGGRQRGTTGEEEVRQPGRRGRPRAPDGAAAGSQVLGFRVEFPVRGHRHPRGELRRGAHEPHHRGGAGRTPAGEEPEEDRPE